MEIRKLGTLESVRVREIWPLEDQDFTPWLAENLHTLEPALKFQLEFIRREDTSGPGRVDILAREVKSGRLVVIENQLEWSDNDHFARLMGYTASRGAGILVWITTGFDQWHRDILDWLNKAGVEVFGIKVSAYRIGENYAPWFEKVVGPNDPGDDAASVPVRVPNIYGRFYRPLTEQLRSAGIFAMGGAQGGWTGKWRKFRSGLSDAGVYYGSQLGHGEVRCMAQLLIYSEANQEIYGGLEQYREEIEGEFPGSVLDWWSRDDQSSITALTDGLSENNEESLEEKRKWMFDNLVALRDAVQPRLEQVLESLVSSNG